MWTVFISSFPLLVFPFVYCSWRERTSLLSFTLFFSFSLFIEKGKENRTWKVTGSSCYCRVHNKTQHVMKWMSGREGGMCVRDVMACEEKGKVLERDGVLDVFFVVNTDWWARREIHWTAERTVPRFPEYESSFPLCSVDVVLWVMWCYIIFLWYSDHKLQEIGESKNSIYRKGWKDSKE